MARRLKAYTVLQAPPGDNRGVVTLGPNDEVPDWALPQLGDHMFEGDAEEEGVPDPVAPAKSANKPEWVDWAVACGAERDEAEAMTKDELVERYGD